MREALLAGLAALGVAGAYLSLNEPDAAGYSATSAPQQSGWVRVTRNCPGRPARTEWRRARPDEQTAPEEALPAADPEYEAPQTRGSVTTAFRRAD